MLSQRFAINVTEAEDFYEKSFTVFIQEGGFVVKNLSGDDEMNQAYQLRHKVFSEDLGWVPQSDNFKEKDGYDWHSAHIGVFDKNHRIVAFSRLVLPGTLFMIEKEFSSLIGASHKIRKQHDTTEASRLCVAPEARRMLAQSDFGSHGLSMLAYKGIYHWCIMHNIRFVYMVVELKVYRMLHAKGFHGQMVGEPRTMPDGCVAVAALIDWEDFIAMNTSIRPRFVQWFTLNGLYQTPVPKQQLESWSQPGAFA
jgi:N-acyl-L-homoserine lactone synthetase